MTTFLFHGCATLIATLFAGSLAWAQSGEASKGSASGPVLPKPVPPFAGKTGPTYKESKPDYPKPVAAPKNAPNVLVDGKQVAAGRVEKTVPLGYGAEGFDVGRDNISAVSPDYTSPFPFSGTVRSVTIAVEK